MGYIATTTDYIYVALLLLLLPLFVRRCLIEPELGGQSPLDSRAGSYNKRIR